MSLEVTALHNLTGNNVDLVFLECQPRVSDVAAPNLVEAWWASFCFHPGRLERHRAKIAAMLEELPDAFHENAGGGYIFTSACFDLDGAPWATCHWEVEKLVALGLATDQVRFTFPREMWPHLPGGAPYFCVCTPRTADPADRERWDAFINQTDETGIESEVAP